MKRLTKILSVVQEGAKRQKQGIEERKVVKEYKKGIENKDKLYNIFTRKLKYTLKVSQFPKHIGFQLSETYFRSFLLSFYSEIFKF